MSSMSSSFTESVSLGESDIYQTGLNKNSMDPYPFYPTMGAPMVYFAQVPKGRIAKRHYERKPSLFVRAFRWYTEEHRPPRKMTPCSIEQDSETDTRQATGSCRNTCEKNEMTAFANWLDMKYAQFLLERPENGNSCCEKGTGPSIVVCENVAYRQQCNPCNPGEVKKRFSKFTRCRRRQSKSADRAYCKTNIQPEGILSISMEYIMAPRSDSPVNSECCQPTPTTTNPSTNKGLAKSHSVTTCKVDEVLPPKIDKPPVEEESYVIKPALYQDYDVTKPTVIEKIIEVQQETNPKKPKRLKQNVSCQCYVRPPSENVETQVSENFQPSSSNTLSQGSANSKQGDKDKRDCNLEQFQRKPSKLDVSSQFVTELKSEAQSQYQNPAQAPPLADKVGVQPIGHPKLTRWQVIASRKQEEQAGQKTEMQEMQESASFRGLCPSFNKPLPKFAVPCPNLNQQCSSLNGPCKPSSLVSSCTRLRQFSTCQQTLRTRRTALNPLKISEPDSQQNPSLKVSCVQGERQQDPSLKLSNVQSESEQQPPIKLSCVQTEPQNETVSCGQELSSKFKKPTNSKANPAFQEPRSSFNKPASALVTPCASLQQPGKRKGRTFEESCCAPEINQTDYLAATSKDSLMEPNTICSSTQIQCSSYKEYQNSKKNYNFNSNETQYDEMNRTCVCGKTIPIRETVCLFCDCDKCACVKYETRLNTSEPSENVKKLSVAQQTSVTGKCCTECPIFSSKAGYGIPSMTQSRAQSVDTKPRHNIGSQTSDHSIRLDNETESQNYPLFMKIVRADKLK